MLKKRIFIFTSYTERLREFGHDFEFDANVWLSFGLKFGQDYDAEFLTNLLYD